MNFLFFYSKYIYAQVYTSIALERQLCNIWENLSSFPVGYLHTQLFHAKIQNKYGFNLIFMGI